MDIELGLDRIKRLLFELGNPQGYLKVIHVAGTNGKGSVISYIYSILRKHSLKVGVYTSPAVFEEMEIIQVNGVNISKEDYDDYMSRVDAAAKKIGKQPTSYEKQTAVAIMYLKDMKCDVCIIETGLGGELDATNVFKKALCSIITTVDYDHTSYLGDTIGEIATAKAGIIKNYSPVVLGVQKYNTVFDIVKQKADDVYAALHCVDKIEVIEEGQNGCFTIKSSDGVIYDGINPKNKAEYQKDNIRIVIEVVSILNYYEYNINKNQVVEGINEAVWPGRFEKVCNNPVVYMDGAHNPNGAEALKTTLNKLYPMADITLVMGIFKDKDYKQVVQIMAPLAKKVYTFTPENERGLDGEELRKVFEEQQCDAIACLSLTEALDSAVVDKENVIIVFGSLSYLKDVKGYFDADW